MNNLQVKQIPVSNLIPYANNARTHTELQIAQISASIKEFGFNNPILTDGNMGVIAGHGRLMAAKKLGLYNVPVVELPHLSPSQKRAFILADNRIALNSGWDAELLQCELDALTADEFDIGLAGFDIDELESIEPDKKEKDILPIKKFSINKTRTAYFFSIRRWDTGNKKRQIRHIQEMKKEINDDFIEKVANDFRIFLSIFKDISGCIITHAPAGNSVRSKFNLATEISKRLSSKLGIEYCKLFSDFPKKTKEVGNYKNKQATELINNIPSGSQVILIDDVATTGTTMETCISLLKDFQIIPVVWVYSEVVNNE